MSDTTDRSSHADRRALPRAVCARRGGVAVACALAVVGLVFLWQAALLDFGDIGLPGPGFFPLLLGAALVGLSVLIGIDHWRESHGPSVEIGHRDVLIVSAALLAVPLLFEALGAYITLGLFGAALLVLIARTPVWLAGAAALIAMAACWYFFQVLLGLQLPTGPL
jgi:putative tricarboxylic transport membrane protein